MTKIVALLPILCLFSIAQAQVTDMGGPFWDGELRLENIPQVEMPAFDLVQAQFEDSINDMNKIGPWRFGYEYITDYDLHNSGVWSTLDNGDRIWRLKIKCPEAQTINLQFRNFHMPEGGYIYLYDVNRTNRVGAYTNRNNYPDQQLGTELVHGEEIILEYYEPAQVLGQGQFVISMVVHGYRSADEYDQSIYGRGMNDSGDCNIDVNCPLGNGWEDQISSVARINVGGGFCSGSLMNNTCEDGAGYFLTANHCGTASGAWVLRWNWESPPGTESCATTANSTNPGSPYDQSSNGCTPLVQNSIADFNLVSINNFTIADAQNWNLYYNGWDNSDALTVSEATGIHHPAGDIKKICREDNAPFHANAGGVQVWQISDWDQGVTEGGSSGSPLYDQNGRVIGQLYAGTAACAGTNDNGGYDIYGRFGVAWTNGVSAYLAPGSCGSVTVLDGFDPNVLPCNGTLSSTSIEEACPGDDNGQITVSVSGGNSPYTYDIGSGPQGSGVFSNLAQGTYSITVLDAAACSASISVTLAGPSGFSDSYTSTGEILGMDGSIDLTVSGGTAPYSYSWTGPNGFTSMIEDPNGLVTGVYSCTVTDNNSCVHSITGVDVGSQLGLTDIGLEFKVYPNPTNGVFNVQLVNSTGDIKVGIKDVTGRMVYTQQFFGNSNFSVDVSEVAEGAYFIEISNGVTRSIKPIVIRK